MSRSWASLSRRRPAPGRLLVATPLLGDPNFARTVVYLLEHDGGGTVGVVLNRPSHTPVGQVLPDWHDVVSGPAVVFGGGPVQPDGALCLGEARPELVALLDADASLGPDVLGPDAPGPDGSAGLAAAGMRLVVDGVSTVDLDGDVALIAPAARRLRVFAGHAGWSPDQLEAELMQGAWWVVAGGRDDLFSDDPRAMWSRVLRRQPAPLCYVSTYPQDATAN